MFRTRSFPRVTRRGRLLACGALLVAMPLAAFTPVVGRGAASAWSPRTMLSAPGGWPVEVVVAPDGAMSAAWARAGDIEFAQRVPGGRWSAVDTLVYGGDSPQLEVDRHGRLYLAWVVAPPGDRGVWKVKEQQRRPGGAWSDSRVVLRRRSSLGVSDYDVSANGAALMAVGTSSGVVVTRRTATGPWADPVKWSNAARADVALGGHGLAAVVLTLYRPTPDDVDVGELVVEVTRQPLGGSWSSPTVLYRDRHQGPPWWGEPAIAVDPAGTATVGWYGTSGGEVGVLAARASFGHGWGAPRLVIPRMGSEHRITLMAARDRSVLVVAVREYGSVLAALRPAHAPWRDPVTVAPRGRFISGWDAARDPGGGAVAAWTRCPGPGFPCVGVWASVMSPSGTWGPQVRLDRAQMPDGTSTWAAMEHGDAVVVWARSNERTGHSPLYARLHPAG